jgi:sugar lactone lactonase YvrE
VSQAQVVGRGLGELLESPRWDRRRQQLSFVDIITATVFVHDSAEGTTQRYPTGLSPVGAVLPHDDGYRLFGEQAVYDWAPGLEPARVCDLPGDLRSNDAAQDPWGAWWVGRMSSDEAEGVGELLRIAPDGITRQATGLTVPNGMGWSADRQTMYFAESAERTVFAVPASADGIAWQRRRPLVVLDDAYPDGLCMTEDGFWLANWDGARVTFHDFTGRERARHDIPARQVSACAMAGKDLFVTTAAEGYSPSDLLKDPLSGSLFVLRGVEAARRSPQRSG